MSENKSYLETEPVDDPMKAPSTGSVSVNVNGHVAHFSGVKGGGGDWLMSCEGKSEVASPEVLLSRFFSKHGIELYPGDAQLGFDEYQTMCQETAIYPDESKLEYLTLGVCSESGELAGHIKKAIRDNGGEVGNRRSNKIKREIGDVLWYLSELSRAFGWSFSDVAKINVAKLLKRKEEDKLGGDGDFR